MKKGDFKMQITMDIDFDNGLEANRKILEERYGKNTNFGELIANAIDEIIALQILRYDNMSNICEQIDKEIAVSENKFLEIIKEDVNRMKRFQMKKHINEIEMRQRTVNLLMEEVSSPYLEKLSAFLKERKEEFQKCFLSLIKGNSNKNIGNKIKRRKR